MSRTIVSWIEVPSPEGDQHSSRTPTRLLRSYGNEALWVQVFHHHRHIDSLVIVSLGPAREVEEEDVSFC